MTIEVEPLTPTIGAIVNGLNVKRLSDSGFADLWQAFVDHSVVFLRDQGKLTPEQHLSFAKRFGEIHVHPAARGREVASDGMMNMRITRDTEVAAGNRWHSDVSCDAQPPQATILQLHTIPTLGGDTLFSSLYAAYETLSERMKVYLDGLTALHSGEESFRHLFKFSDSAGEGWPENHHPLVRKHVDSGRPVLFVDREFTRQIDNLPREEGRALLEFLFNHTERVAFQCRFRWTPNAIAIWDNRCALHHAMWDYWPSERLGRRITVKGESPVVWQLTKDHAPAPERPTVRLTK